MESHKKVKPNKGMKKQICIIFSFFLLVLVFYHFPNSFISRTFATMPPDQCEEPSNCGCGYCCNSGMCEVGCSATNPCPTPTIRPENPTNTPPPGSTSTPGVTSTPGATPTPGGECSFCDVNCSSGATASYWQARGWPSNSPQCCLVCGSADMGASPHLRAAAAA